MCRRLFAEADADPGVVQKSLAHAQTPHQGIDRSTDQIIDWLSELVQAHGRIKAVQQVVARVVVVDQTRFVHAALPGALALKADGRTGIIRWLFAWTRFLLWRP